MNNWGKILKIAKIALPAVAIMLFLQQIPTFYDTLFSHKVKLTETPGPIYNIEIASLPKGDYFVSIGRPRAHCDIFRSGDKIFAGRSTVSDVRQNLLAGAYFRIDNQDDGQLVINCDHFQSGFDSRLSFSPKIYNSKTGMIAHLIRASIETVIGPVSSLILLLTAVIHYFSSGKGGRKGSHVFLAYGIISFIYSISLSYYTRLFISGMDSSILHVGLRILFSIGFNYIINPNFRNRTTLIALHILCLPLTVLFSTSTVELETFYRVAYLLFPISTFVSFLDLIKHESQSRVTFFMQSIALSWAIAQSMDFVKLNTNFGFYAAPLFLMFVSAFLVYKVINDIQIRIRAESISHELQRDMHKSETNELLILSCVNAVKCLDKRIDCLIMVDDFLINRQTKTGISFTALPYQQDIETSQLCDFRKVDFKVSDLFTIRLFTKTKYPEYVIHEAVDILSIAITALKAFETFLVNSTSSMNQSLSKLRASMGEGVHDRQIGAIFIDIVDYSKHTESLGNDYTTFISSNVIPLLIQEAKNEALPEVVRGDEVLFVVCTETCRDENISSATEACVAKLMRAIDSTVFNLCKEYGFPKVEVRLGFTVGEGTLVVDSIQVRSSGDHINRAKRLQDVCKKNEVWTDQTTISSFEPKSLVVIKNTQIVVKKNIIEAVKVGVKRAA